MNRHLWTYSDEKPKPVTVDPGEQIAQDIKDYLAKGGTVKEVPNTYARFRDAHIRSWARRVPLAEEE